MLFRSSSGGFISTTILSDNTVLGMKNGKISSINSEELQEIISPTGISTSLSSITETLNLSSETVNLTTDGAKFSAPILQAKAVYSNSERPSPAQRGMIIFNYDTNKFEGYNGTEWKEFNW